MRFQQDIVTEVPTECLVEDYQSLVKGLESGDWSEVQCVIECLSDTISRYTKVPEGLNIRPSGNSAICMSMENGIITDDDGNDLLCAQGLALSDTECCTGFIQNKDGTQVQCPWHINGACDPEHCCVMLNSGHSFVPFEFEDKLELTGENQVDFK